MGDKKRRIVIVNQAVNYLTIGLCNSFSKQIDDVALITGSIHEQGEKLVDTVNVKPIIKWEEKPAIKKFYSYLIGTFQIWWHLLVTFRNHEVLFVSIPPNAYLLSLFIRNRSSMLIWDVYPDVFKITGISEKHIFYRFWAYLNKRAFRKAYRLYTIGDKMSELLSQYVDTKKILITPIWSVFQENLKIEKERNPFVGQNDLSGKFVVQYSGNIGLTHRVEILIEIASKLEGIDEEIIFQIIGRGPRVEFLKNLVIQRGLKNCQFLPFQKDEMFPYSLSAADLGVVILDDLTSKGSVPSKTYNLMSFGIPILSIASADSELFSYCKKYNYGACISSQDLDECARFILNLKQDAFLQSLYSANSSTAALNYRRTNADKIVDLYF